MQERTLTYGMSVEVPLAYERAVARAREELGKEGFGVLTEIDVAATLKAKLDVDRPPYKILGACNPSLADQALDAEEGIGLLLPCNVVVYQQEGGSVVAALEPLTMVDLTGNAALEEVAGQAKQLLAAALDSLPA